MSVDLTTRYLGLSLASPLVASASPLTGKIESLIKLERAGAAAVVLPSLFEEQIEHEATEIDRLHALHSDSMSESSSFFPVLQSYNTGPESYLSLIQQAHQTLSIPVIASLNGCSRGGWTSYAQKIEEAGASALELNIYFVPNDQTMDGHAVEQQYYDLVAAIRAAVSIPLAVKIGPYFTAMPNFSRKLIDAGADGIVLFNRYLAPDIDLEHMRFLPDLVLSRPDELRLSLRWVAILRDQLAASLAVTSGVHEVTDVVKALMVGADVVLIATALLQRGPAHLQALYSGLETWLEVNHYDSVRQLKGSMSKANSPNPEGLERANYMQTLVNYTRAMGS